MYNEFVDGLIQLKKDVENTNVNYSQLINKLNELYRIFFRLVGASDRYRDQYDEIVD